MSSYSAIDALLAAHTPLPLPVERSRVRRSLGISVEEVAQVVGVSPEVLHAWEEGLAVPEGHPRDAYAYFLHRAHIVVDYCARAVGKRDPAPAPAAAAAPRHTRPVREIPAPRRGRAQHAGTAGDPIREAVVAETAAHAGDPHGAIEALTARAVPDAVRMFETLRVGGRYDIVRRPALPEILRTPAPTAPGGFLGGPRLDWQRSGTGEQDDLVAALGINAPWLSAFKTHLPLGQLQAADPQRHDRHRAGIHLVTPPLWEHGGYLPHPLGPLPASTEPVWITEPTLRLLLRLSGPRYWLCAPPVVHESWTAPSTEGLLEKFRIALRDARSRALGEDDTVTLAYVKALYTGFVRALGEVSERALHRPDWMHLIHAQAFANVWSKAYRAHTEGLVVMKVNGSDELHLQGDWRQVFEEGRDLSQLRLRGTYKITADDCGSTSAPGAQCSDPYAEKRRYEYAGGRYVGCRSCGGDLCTSCRMTHLAPADVPVQHNDDNVCGACR